MKFLIWCFERNAWWKESRRGYAEQREKAGRYSLEEAVEICLEANKHSLEEAIVPDSAI